MSFILLTDAEYFEEETQKMPENICKLININHIAYISIDKWSGSSNLKTNDGIEYRLSKNQTDKILRDLKNLNTSLSFIIEPLEKEIKKNME